MTRPLTTVPTHIVVLAGGGSRRMGLDKAALKLHGETLLDRTIALAAGTGLPVVVAAGGRRLEEHEQHTHCEDGPGRGPLAGLLGAAEVAPDASWLALACDLPLLSANMLDALLTATAQHKADLLVPTTEVSGAEQLHPLTAVYAPAALAALRKRALSGRYSLAEWITEVCNDPSAHIAVAKLDAASLGYDRQRFARELSNCNTPDDWQRIQALAKRC